MEQPELFVDSIADDGDYWRLFSSYLISDDIHFGSSLLLAYRYLCYAADIIILNHVDYSSAIDVLYYVLWGRHCIDWRSP